MLSQSLQRRSRLLSRRASRFDSWVLVTTTSVCPLRPLMVTALLFLAPSLSLVISLDTSKDHSDHWPHSLLSTLGSQCLLKEMLVAVSYFLAKWMCTYILFLDPRVEDWLLMSSPLPQTIILGFYVYFVTSLGPKLMENRKPFELKKAMITYNFSIVLFSVYMCYEASVFSILNRRILPESSFFSVIMCLVIIIMMTLWDLRNFRNVAH